MDNATFLQVEAHISQWESTTLNGIPDMLGSMPLRHGNCWTPIIDLRSGQVLNWPQGIEATVFYKVCDNGTYWLLNDASQRIAQWNGYYVPDALLCIGYKGYGDYILLRINTTGFIQNWNQPTLDPNEWNPT